MKSYEIISDILRQLQSFTKIGVKTIDINNYAEELIEKYECKSANKGYKPDWANTPFPCSICINRNNVIAHGIPGEQVIEDGDIVSIDLGIIDKNGECADAALSFGVGNITNEKKKLLYHAYKTMMEGIKFMRAGENIEFITRRMELYAKPRHYQINRRFAGHRIGKEMHMKPNIYNTIEAGHKWGKLKEGEIYCIEPMLTSGKDSVGVPVQDGWAFVTLDNKPSVFFEHMVRVTKNGPVILTNHIIEPSY